VESQLGRRWLREQTYVEDGVADAATRLQETRDGDKDAEDSGMDDEVPENSKVDLVAYGNMMVSPETQQRTVKVKPVNTKRMGPVERHNHLIKEAKSLAEVGSRTPANNTHVASIVLSALTKGMTGHDTTGLTTTLEALLGQLPSMIAHGQQKASKVMCIVMNIQCCLSLMLCMCGL
jgi:hypothetical protein